MSAGKRVIDPQTYTVMTWWLKSWLGLWPPGRGGENIEVLKTQINMTVWSLTYSQTS